MKIKNIILSIACILSLIPNGYAQRGSFEGTFNIGYGFMGSPQSVQSTTSTSTIDVPYSLGTGLNIDLAGNYILSDHMGLGLDLNDQIGTPAIQTNDNGVIQAHSEFTGNLFAITPMLTLSANSGKINPYGKFGFVIGIPSATLTTTESGPNTPTGKEIDKLTGNLAVGWYAAFGLQFPVTDHIAINAELFDRMMGWEPAQLTNTQAFDGQSTHATITYSKTADVANPHTSVAQYFPFSSAGIKVGITMKFGGK